MSGETTPSQLLDYYWQRIERCDPEINAFAYRDCDYARDRATEVAARLENGDTSRVIGLPTADKDLVARAGMPTGYGSSYPVGPDQATSSDPMARWLDSAGAISVGKTTTSEFGMAASTEALATGPTRNPHDTTRSAGGSSGGAAAAVAAGMLPFAPGSDGGGSIRIPALACGVVGWKPSRGLVPAGSGFEFLGGLAVPGLITRSVEDLIFLADTLRHGDYHWATRAPVDRGLLEGVASMPSRATIGVTTASPWPADWGVGPSDDALVALDMARQALLDAGHTVVDLDWRPDTDYAEAFMTLWTSNAATLPVPDDDVDRVEPLTRYLISRGRQVMAVDLVRALGFLRTFERETIATFSPFDAVLTPGLSGPVPQLGWYDPEDALMNFRQQVQVTPWTSFVNVAGLPAIAWPTHYTASGLPVGAQLIGRPGADANILALAAQVERRLPGATRQPPGFAN